MQNLKIKLAFTLAEVLVVMGIIGVVASLTIPNLATSTNDKEIVAKVKKINGELNDAFARSRAKYGTGNLDNIKQTRRILEFMNVDHECSTTTDCIAFLNMDKILLTLYSAIETSGSAYAASQPPPPPLRNPEGSEVALILADGMSMLIGPNSVKVDIDGPNKGFNTDGIDIFMFNFDYDSGRVKPYGSVYDRSEIPTWCANGQVVTYGCADWIIKFDNVDYLHCALTLNVSNGTTACK